MKTEKQQTAVEFLIQELFNNGYFPYGVPEDIVKKAKEMEKQQIMQTRQDIYVTGDLNNEQYYTKTFKSE
jgi:hypothetical protein